jgi:ubiquinone/menaquinone biosynthesis C-methylase UbiE
MSINYDRNARIYDARHGGEIAPHIAQSVIALSELKPGDGLLDLASGTGRGCLGFARQGLLVTATDISAEMLRELMRKSAGLSLQTQLMSAAELGFKDASFDAVSVSRALYLISDWRESLAQMSRVLKPGGAFIHEWGSGSESDVYSQIRAHLRGLLLAAGVEQIFHPGAGTEGEVERELSALGFASVGAVETGPGMSITPRKFIEKITARECSYLWDVSRDIAEPAMEKVWTFARQEFGDMDREIFMPENSFWRVYRRAGERLARL